MSTATGVVIAHPHGNANVRQAALAFAEAGVLHEFWTGVAWNPDAALARLAPARLRRQLERRAVAAALRPHLRLHPWREALRLASRQLRLAALAGNPALSPNACHEDLDRRVARVLHQDGGRRIGTVYAYDHCALESFRVARRLGQRRIYDLPIGHWRALERTLRREAQAWPEWRALVPEIDFGTPAYARKDLELGLAERIVVPSRFVARTLAEHLPALPAATVVPFGAPAAAPLDEADLASAADGPLRLLYVGALDLRKGVQYLCAAQRHWRGRATLTVIGRPSARSAALDAALASCRRVETLPHPEVLAEMRRSPVFVFPTLFEGMALVVPEAMSQGCAVITTAESGAEDLIEDGVNGFLVPSRDPEALGAAVVRLHDDRELLARVRRAAQRTARAWSWERYRAALLATAAPTTARAA